MANFHQPQQRQQQQQAVGESQDGVPDHYWFPLGNLVEMREGI